MPTFLLHPPPSNLKYFLISALLPSNISLVDLFYCHAMCCICKTSRELLAINARCTWNRVQIAAIKNRVKCRMFRVIAASNGKIEFDDVKINGKLLRRKEGSS